MESNNINWNDLKYFLAVVREGSLAKAAQTLRVTHSTVFRRLNTLEEEVGTKLFSRLPEGYQLTEKGHDILVYVDNMSEQLVDLRRAVESDSQEMQGPIQVTAPHNLAYNFLPQYIAEFRQQYPQVTFNIVVSNADFNLSRGEADIAIRATPKPPEHLIGHHLLSLKWGAFASPAYLKRNGTPTTPEQLTDHAIISSTSDLLKLTAFSWVESNIAPQNIVSRCNDLMSMSAMAEAGNGIALLPDDQIKPSLRRLFTLPFLATSEIWVLIHPDLKNCRRLKVFREFVIEAFKESELFKHYEDQETAVI